MFYQKYCQNNSFLNIYCVKTTALLYTKTIKSIIKMESSIIIECGTNDLFADRNRLGKKLLRQMKMSIERMKYNDYLFPVEHYLIDRYDKRLSLHIVMRQLFLHLQHGC